MTTVETAQPERFQFLYRTSLEFNSTLNPDELLSTVFDRALETVDGEAGSIWLRQGDALTCRIARGPVATKIEGLELPLGAGIVGDVALRGESELVVDARQDARFVHQVDEATGFETRSMAAVPLRAKDEILGVLQVLNKRSGAAGFDEEDLELLEGLGATAGLALRNAQLHDAERRAHDLRALLAISREITSTLDSDRLALSVVNLGSQALAYDRAAIALEKGGTYAVRAISGQERLDPRSEEVRELERLIVWLAERGEVVYVPDVGADEEPAVALWRGFADLLERRGIGSLCLVLLQDEEGRLGAFYMESTRTGFLGESGLEAARLLANQASVALRNAQLYGQVPLIGLLQPVAEWRSKLASMPRRRLAWRLGIGVAVLLAFVAFPWAERITPREARILPGDRAPLRATVGGLVSEVLVSEGDQVGPGQPVAVLRDDDLRMRVEETEGELSVAERGAAAARARGEGGAARLLELKITELQARRELLRDRLGRTRLEAPFEAMVLTLRPHERVGEWLGAGETFILLGRTDRLELEARVEQKDIARVREGNRVRLKVPARPTHIFVGRITEIAPHADLRDGETEPAFVVRASLDNGHGLLRPGMEARAKIVGSRRPLGALLIRPLVRWTQLRLWR